MVGYRSGNPALQRVPIYFQLRELFIERIRAGVWSVRTPLPSELQLAGEFGVSVGTVRRVMDELSDLGLVKRSRGRGTFVNDVHAVSGLNGLDPFRNLDGSRIAWDPPSVHAEIGAASATERHAFGENHGNGEVLRLTWLMTRNERIVAHQQSTVPLITGVDVTQSHKVGSLAELYVRSGILVHKCEDILGFDVPDRVISEKMDVAEGVPLHRLTRKMVDERKAIVGISNTWLIMKNEVYTSTQRIVEI